MSSSGYPQIEFGYDDATDEDEESDSADGDSTSLDDQALNGGGLRGPKLVSCSLSPDRLGVVNCNCRVRYSGQMVSTKYPLEG